MDRPAAAQLPPDMATRRRAAKRRSLTRHVPDVAGRYYSVQFTDLSGSSSAYSI